MTRTSPPSAESHSAVRASDLDGAPHSPVHVARAARGQALSWQFAVSDTLSQLATAQRLLRSSDRGVR